MGLVKIDWQEDLFSQIADEVEGARTIALCAHTDPDGDALGSELGLMQIIAGKWKDKEVVGLLADDAPTPRIYSYLPGIEGLRRVADYDGTPDLFITVDLSEAKRLHLAEPVMRRACRNVVIDHHPCEAPYGDVNLVRPSAAACGVIVTELAVHLGARITPAMATCLYCAVSTDTGRFQYQNADPEAFAAASLLVNHGASPAEHSLHVYQNFSLEFLHLESVVMGRITTFAKGKIAYSYATQADIKRTGASLDECDGLIDVVRSVAGTEVALFLKELPDGRVRGNLRSKTGGHDVAAIARQLGGGGHKAAAGFTVEGGLDQAFSKALPLLVALFDETPCADGPCCTAGGSAR